MEITRLRLADLKPYANNVKLHPKEQIEQIKQSIKEFGNNDPIAVDEDYVIIEGHGRYQALTEMGEEYAECIVLEGMTEDQKNAYRLVHNKLTMNSDFDLAGLQEELDKIAIDMEKYDFLMEDENPRGGYYQAGGRVHQERRRGPQLRRFVLRQRRGLVQRRLAVRDRAGEEPIYQKERKSGH